MYSTYQALLILVLSEFNKLGDHSCLDLQIIEFGGEVRSTGATGVNADSSRSHAILQLELKVVNTEEHLGR